MRIKTLIADCVLIGLLFLSLLLSSPGYPGEELPAVNLELTYPVGKSPRVFTEGWVFGARCIVNPGSDERDISGTVRWSGSATFNPSVGAVSRPDFHGPGENNIILTVDVGDETIEKKFQVIAIRPTTYASIADISHCQSDAHGCPACPHAVAGPIITGSRNVTINGKPAARVGDTGVASACCGPNTFTIKEGDPTVLIDGQPAARIGDATAHCGGTGEIISGAILSDPGYYVLFRLRLPTFKDGIIPEPGDEESDAEYEMRMRAFYKQLTYSDFRFEDLPIDQSPFIIHVSGDGRMVYPRDKFIKGTKWKARTDAYFNRGDDGTLNLKGAFLLTMVGTYDSMNALLSSRPELRENDNLEIWRYSAKEGKATLSNEQCTTTMGQLTPDWIESYKREATKYIKTILSL